MFRRLAKKQLKLAKKPLDILYESEKIKKFIENKKKIVPLDIIYREKRLITYLFGNHLAFLGQILLTYILTEAFQVWHMSSFGISLGLAFIFMFFFHHYITFGLTDSKYRHFPLFLIITSIVYISSWSLVFLITKFLGWHYILAIILASIPASLTSYILNKNFVFRIPKFPF